MKGSLDNFFCRLAVSFEEVLLFSKQFVFIACELALGKPKLTNTESRQQRHWLSRCPLCCFCSTVCSCHNAHKKFQYKSLNDKFLVLFLGLLADKEIMENLHIGVFRRRGADKRLSVIFGLGDIFALMIPNAFGVFLWESPCWCLRSV